MQHKIETMFRQEVQDFLEATKPSKCLLAYHSITNGPFLFQNIGVTKETRFSFYIFMNTNIDISKQNILYILNKMYILKMIFTYIGIANEVKK